MAQRQMELEAVTGERHRTEEELGAQKTAAAELRAQIEAVRSGLLASESAQNLARRHPFAPRVLDRFGEAALRRDRNARRAFNPLGVLADFVDVDPAYERAAEEFLHDELEYVVVEDWDQAERGMGLLRAGSEGRATFLVHSGAGLQACQPGAGGRACRASPTICA